MAIHPKTLFDALALATVLATFLLLASACSHMQSTELGPEQTAELAATAMAAQGGNGFVCDGGNSTFTCFCKKGATGNFSCKGMAQLCRPHKVICSPDGWCHCGGLYPKVR
ncbi:hypothetical protein ACFQZQ_13100 [Lysobacter koreensis]|uniref:Uncharacterized protein n=1 Tax=Lysobacter koreensis TaxID=266122 RepID=A0ABW2YR89_9GAMM